MAIKKTELYSSLWASADELRGGMDASEYKNYVLTLLFMKYVTDKYENDPDGMIVIPEGASFTDMVALAGNKEIGDKINKIIAALAEANGLKNIIDNADFNDSTKLGSDKEMVDRLSKLVRIFDSLDLGANSAEGDDLLGDAYEYLMRHFATESGKSKGQFYTPSEVSAIMPQVIGIGENSTQDMSVYDPTCGSGSLLLKAASFAPNGLSIYGQEKEVATTALCRMNMILHSNETAEIAPGGQSTLAKPFFTTDNETKLKTFDYVVANPPFSLKAWTSGMTFPDEFGRFDGFVEPPEKNGDYAFLLHMIKSLKSTGKAAVILPHGVLFRGNTEGSIREKLIKKGYIKGIIGLPANLFYGTGIPAAIIVLDKEHAQARRGIYMIDASKGFKKDGNKNRLREQDVHKIVDTFNKQLEMPKYARMVTLKEIEENEYNLNIPRYIDSSDSEDIHDLFAHLNGGIPKADVDDLDEYWDIFANLKNELFTPSTKEGYYNTNIVPSAVKQTIMDSDEYKAFKKSVIDTHLSWRSLHEDMLFNLDKGCHPKAIIKELSESLLEKFKDVKLLDKYDLYQLVMDYYAEVMQDDFYLISQDGWKVGNVVRQLIPSKDSKGKNVYKEVHDFEFKKVRYKADLIPPKLIIDTYFQAEQKAIDELQVKLDSASSELESFIEDNSGEDGLLEDAKTDKGSITKTSVAKRLKETSDEDEIEALKTVKKLIEDEAKAKKALKNATDALSLEVFKKYPKLSVDEIKELVLYKKWYQVWLTDLQDEIERVTSSLANRIKTLEERYSKPLGELDGEVKELESRVETHLKAMRLSW
ncbi:type I restriction-modification system subunit M [Sulfurimonas sp. NW7]|uniref:type I restriction-modification system subunit M n=1 Tax=Sulfurimonas sp. NW7 TaxID=2922727 RepID=UPI003DA8D0C7